LFLPSRTRAASRRRGFVAGGWWICLILVRQVNPWKNAVD
jgi:hypothetical protein